MANMRQFILTVLTFISLITASTAAVKHKHQHAKRATYDLDGNGIPDWCYTDASGAAVCLEKDGWTTIKAAATQVTQVAAVPATSSVAAAATTVPQIAAPAYNPAVPATIVPTATAAQGADAYTPSGTGAPAAYYTSKVHKNFPSVKAWNAGNGSTWKLSDSGKLGFTGRVATDGVSPVVGDKCRTGKVGGNTVWTCGDVMCKNGDCGFNMGPGFYATDNSKYGPVNTDCALYTDYLANVHPGFSGNLDFGRPWNSSHGSDLTPQLPWKAWGMDTSNVVPIDDTTSIAYVFAAWRGADNNSPGPTNRGAAAVKVTNGSPIPIATRFGPYLNGEPASGSSADDLLQLGLLAILRDGDYIYHYSAGGGSNVVVSRVLVSDALSSSDISKYEFHSLSGGWKRTSTYPKAADLQWGVTVGTFDKKFFCDMYGSVFWSDAWGVYVLMCTRWAMQVSLYVADAPEGPWSDTYKVMDFQGYGSMAHPEFGSDKLYWTVNGWDGLFRVKTLEVTVTQK